MKAATSLDNRVSAKVGERTRISSDDSLRHAHALRAEIDAIAVGSGTVLADDPLLTARECLSAPSTDASAVRSTASDTALGQGVLDARRGTGNNRHHAREHRQENRVRAGDLQRAGAELEPISSGALPDAFGRLGDRQMMSLVLEGGVALQAAAWKAGLVDAVHLYVAPMALGDEGVSWLDADTVSIASLIDRRGDAARARRVHGRLCSRD